MVEHRTLTVISWLRAARLITEQDQRYFFGALPMATPVLNYNSVAEPLLPRRFNLEEYEIVAGRAHSAQRSITYEIDRGKLDRANSMHETLTNLVAEKIRQAGGIPKRNPLIDLATQIGRERFIFEIKTTPTSTVRAQVRKGISQLYEYRYLQHMPDAKLVLVTEQALPSTLRWMGDYLIKDRGILLVWDGDSRTLRCSDDVRQALGFLLC